MHQGNLRQHLFGLNRGRRRESRDQRQHQCDQMHQRNLRQRLFGLNPSKSVRLKAHQLHQEAVRAKARNHKTEAAD